MRSLFIIAMLTTTLSYTGFGQVKYQGVTKLSVQQSLKNINGTWDKADLTGNAVVDKILAKLVSLVPNNLKAVKALETSAANVKANPEAYLNPDGSVKKEAFTKLITAKFGEVGEVTIPSLPTIVDSTGSLR